MFEMSVMNLQTSSTERSITTPCPSTLVMSATLQLQGRTGNVSTRDGASICDLFAAVPAGLIFGLAGRWDLWNVWVYVGILLALSLFRDLVMYRKSPDLFKERFKPASGR